MVLSSITIQLMPPAWVYLLRCSDDSLYCGWTNDLDKRLAAHQKGIASKYTRPRRPVELALTIECESYTQARKEEARIKKLTRAEKLTLIKSISD